MTCEGESTPWLFSVFLPTFYYFFCSFSECTDTKQILEWQYFGFNLDFYQQSDVGIKPRTAVLKVQTIPLCYAVPILPTKMHTDFYKPSPLPIWGGEILTLRKKSWAIKKQNSKFDFQKKINFDENIRRLFLTEMYFSTKLGRFWLI